jgi:hypothetical protein
MLTRQPEQLPDYRLYDVKKRIDTCYTTNSSYWMAHQTEAMIDTRLEAGDVSLTGDIGPNPQFYNGRPSWFFNKVRPLCNMVSGYQRSHRKSVVCMPLEGGDEQTADQITKVLFHIFKKTQFDDMFSEAFHQGACISGMNLMQIYLDFQDDPIFGDIKFRNLPFNQFFIDPYSRNKDLSDCNFIWVRSYLTHGAAASLLPQFYDEIMSLPANPTGAGRDGRFLFMPQSYGISGQNLVSYDEYYYRDYRTRKILIDNQTGLWREIHQDEIDSEMFDYLMASNPQLEVQEQTIGTVRLAIMVQDKVFYDGPNPFGIDDYPFTPVVGYYNPMMPYYYTRLQGICRSLRDPQMLLNRRILLNLDIMESVANTGYVFKVGSVVDMKHLFQTGQGRIIPLKDEAQMTDVMPITPPNVPPAMFQMEENLGRMMTEVSGVNQELMGMATDDKAGVLAMLRQGAGLVTLQPLFDNLDFSLKMIGEKVLKIMTSNYGPMKIKQILEGQEPMPQFYNKAFGKYHCIVEEGYNTATQKQLQFAQLMQMREMGIAIPDADLIKAATLQNKQELIQSMQQQQQQAQQMQQMQAQMQMQQAQAQIQLTQARAIADQGLGLERASRVAENQALAVERTAQADKDEEDALLSFVRAMKEIEGLDIENLHKMTQIANLIKERRYHEKELYNSQVNEDINKRINERGENERLLKEQQKYNYGI